MSRVVVISQPGKGLQHEIKAGKHVLRADAGADVGGNDSAPNPHELMLSALGACTSMTLQLFAQRRGWELESVTVELIDETIDNPDAPGKKIPRITREIAVTGNLNAEQLESLKQIADKCPIHKLLAESKQIVTNLEALNHIA